MLLQAIVGLCLRHRLPVAILAAVFVIFAGFHLLSAQYGVFPEFIPPTVTIQTQAPGLDPAQVEALVTDRLELALGGLPGLAKTQSQSQAGLSVVKLVFHGGTDIYRDRELVAGGIASVTASLPPRITPVITPLQSSTGTVMVLGLQSDRMSLMRLTALMQTVIRPALLNVPGVAQVVGFGSAPAQLTIEAHPGRLIAARLGLNRLAVAAHDASLVRGGGWIDTGNQQLVLETHGQARTVRDLAGSVIAAHRVIPLTAHRASPLTALRAISLTLGDLATIRRTPPPRYGMALVHGKPGLVLVIGTLYGANTLAVTDGLHQALARLAPTLHDQGVHVVVALEVASFIHTALRHVTIDLAIGAGLILLVLLLALRNWRVTLISFVSIPVSLLAATEILRLLGIDLTIMALAGLAIALGAVVDDAVVDAENIFRRLRENHARPDPAPPFEVILHASVEVRSAIIYATVAVVIVFIPILLIGGVAGRIFAPLGIAYIAAILASLVVALTLTPALAGLLLTGTAVSPLEPGPIRAAHRLYGRVLDAVNRRFRLFAALVALLFAAAAVSLAGIGFGFLPQFNARQVIMHYQTAPGTSLDTMSTIGQRVFERFDHEKSVQAVVMHLGRANLGNGHPGTNKAEIDMTVSRNAASHVAATARHLLHAIEGAPGTRFWVNSFLAERLHEGLSGFTAPLIVTVYGPNMKPLGRDAERIAATLRTLPGHAAITLEAPPNTAAISIRPRRGAMRRDGVTARTLLGTVAAAYAGQTIGQVYHGVRIEPIVLTLPQRFRHDPTLLATLPIETTAGAIVPLGSVATIRDTSAPQLILHDGGRRVQVISVATAAGHSTAFLAAARHALKHFHFAQGDYITFGGTAVSAGAARTRLLATSAIAVIAILCLLAIALENGRSVALLASTLPFALIGGIAATWLTGATISLGAMVGFVTLFGIALRNGLMLMTHYTRLVRDQGQPWTITTIRQGAMDRLPAILITAIVTALGLLPLALGTGTTGDEIEGPMAIVILGGLLSATVLTLLLLPGLALRGRVVGGVEGKQGQGAPPPGPPLGP